MRQRPNSLQQDSQFVLQAPRDLWETSAASSLPPAGGPDATTERRRRSSSSSLNLRRLLLLWCELQHSWFCSVKMAVALHCAGSHLSTNALPCRGTPCIAPLVSPIVTKPNIIMPNTIPMQTTLPARFRPQRNRTMAQKKCCELLLWTQGARERNCRRPPPTNGKCAAWWWTSCDYYCTATQHLCT